MNDGVPVTGKTADAQDYMPPRWLRNAHLQSVLGTSAWRRRRGVRALAATGARTTSHIVDGGGGVRLHGLHSAVPGVTARGLVLLLHGLEGDAQRPYITGSARLLTLNGHDCCALNLRGCSGSPNRLYESYHSGATRDLKEVLDHILQTTDYDQIHLKGFSLGGNLLLKFLGEEGELPKQLKGAVAVSVPCDLKSSCQRLHSPENFLYHQRFKRHLLAKLRQKQALFPDRISAEELLKIKTLRDFDEIYTSRAHHFEDALDYYQKCSSLGFLPDISLPCLLINAKNDSFLGPECFPMEAAQNNPKLFLETPAHGGHVGFWGKNNITYTEKRALEFFGSL